MLELNTKFTRWTVLNRDRKEAHHGYYWICKCDCGTVRSVRESLLTNGISKSCGCYMKNAMKHNKKGKRLPLGVAARNQLKAQYIRGARSTGREWGISDKLFVILTSDNCYYCGSPPSQIIKARKHNGECIYNGIDRLDNDKGYIEDNVVSCCIICNRAKRRMPFDRFMLWVRQISSFNKDRFS